MLALIYGRAPKSNQATSLGHFVHGQRYSMVAAMGIKGYIATHIVEGSVDGDEFFEFIVNSHALQPSILSLFYINFFDSSLR